MLKRWLRLANGQSKIQGAANIAVGIKAPVKVTIDGHAGYYCAGMKPRSRYCCEWQLVYVQKI